MAENLAEIEYNSQRGDTLQHIIVSKTRYTCLLKKPFSKKFQCHDKKLEIKSNQPVSILETAKISSKVFLLDSKKFF